MVDSKFNMPVNYKGSQPQIQRIKKQDEDDHWISEEELYTEGSSDEEKPSHTSRKHNLKGRKSDIREKNHSPTGKSKPHEKSAETLENSVTDQRDISWRPKRGSIKLPGIDLSEITQPSDMH